MAQFLAASDGVDNNGNTATKVDSTGTTQYFWDFENRLSSVTLPGSGGTVSFKYDPFGRRIYKSSSSGTSIFAYDGDNLIEETNAAGAAVARYEQTQNIDEPLAMFRSGATSYFHADGLGSVTSLSNAAGSIVQTYTFDSFGKQTASIGSLTNSFRYTAREFDTETGLYYYRARYYDPPTGRFISEDPLGFNGGDADLYRYVWNSPLDFIDPIGKWGVGLSGSASVETGVYWAGTGATGSLGAGLFFDGLHPSVGGFSSFGGFAGGPGWGKSYPACPSKKNFVIGGFAGGGANVFVTNANNVRDLSGPFETYSFNIGWGVRVLSLQFSIGQNDAGRTIGVFSYGGPIPGVSIPTGGGYGLSISKYNTNTRTTKGGGECPCH